MPAATHKSQIPATPTDALSTVSGLVLVRISSAGGATRAQIVRDLAPLVSHKLSPAEWRDRAGAQTAQLLETGLCVEARGRLTLTADGVFAAETFLGSKSPKTESSWPDQRDGRLIAKALGLDRIGPTILKTLARPDGLRAVILGQAFGFKVTGSPTPSGVRGCLALVALERAFGNKIKSGLGSGSGFSARAGRLLAGQLSAKPRDFGTDIRLITHLAAEAVDARQTDTSALRAAILKEFVTRGLKSLAPVESASRKATRPANDKGVPGAGPHAVRRPGLDEFSRLVKDAAELCAQGWAGNRKALICKVWDVIKERHPGWALSPIEFKCMLVEAHRGGLLLLASADLKSKEAMDDLESSQITYKNTVWHLIRVLQEDG